MKFNFSNSPVVLRICALWNLVAVQVQRDKQENVVSCTKHFRKQQSWIGVKITSPSVGTKAGEGMSSRAPLSLLRACDWLARGGKQWFPWKCASPRSLSPESLQTKDVVTVVVFGI